MTTDPKVTPHVIVVLTSDVLRKIADQLDAHTALKAAGAEFLSLEHVISIDGENYAYLGWWEDRQEHTAQITSFVPRTSTPLRWHLKDYGHEDGHD